MCVASSSSSLGTCDEGSEKSCPPTRKNQISNDLEVANRLTFSTENKCTDGLKAKVFRHEFAHFLEEACEAPLSANLRSQLQCIDHSLLFLVDFLLRLNFFNLHGQIRAEYLKNLLISLCKAHVLVLSLDDSRLALNNE